MSAKKKTVAGLVVERVPITSVFVDPANTRLHPVRNLESITASLKSFGQAEPLVVQQSTGRIIGGNGRHVAMVALGYTEVDIVRLAVDDSTATRLSIALNRTGELAEWDFQALSEQFRALTEQKIDLVDLGWLPHEIEPLLQADWSPPAAGQMPGSDGDGKHTPHTYRVTEEQRVVIDGAIAQVRKTENDPAISVGRCLELICADFLSGAPIDSSSEPLQSVSPATKGTE